MAGALGVALLGTSGAIAGSGEYSSSPVIDPVPLSSGSSKSFADKLWDLPVLYKNEDNPYIQKVALTGRYQGQWHHTDADTGEDDGWENRRWRFGGKIQFLQDFTLKGEFNLDTTNDLSGERFFRDIDSLELDWKISDTFELAVGKMKPKITQEYSVSSKKILTFERSLIVNQIVPDKVWGVAANGDYGKFDWQLGVFSGGLDGDYDFPEFDAGVGYNASFGFDLSDESKIRFDYIYNDGDEDNNGFEDYDNIFSFNTTTGYDDWGLNTDLIYATGIGDTDDVFGLILLPYYNITKKLQLVGRYQFATSSSDDGIRLQSRYERPAVDDGSGDRGDDYHAFYAGLNYYLYGHKLKLMNGIEYSTLGGDADFGGYTFFTGVRLYF